ncbi:Transport and Golgi organization protein 1, partial [Pseudolycoriella hygida]
MKKIILFIENFLLILFTISLSSAQIKGPRKCANEICSEPISTGRAILTYTSPNDFNLSFKIKDIITVYAKPVTETADDIWHVEINGKKGYAPK